MSTRGVGVGEEGSRWRGREAGGGVAWVDPLEEEVPVRIGEEMNGSESFVRVSCTVASKSGWTGKNAWRMGQRCGDDRHNHCSGPTNPTGAPNHIRSVLCFSNAYHMVLCVCASSNHKPDTG